MALPIALYSAAQVRALDAHATGQLGIPAYTLMKRAGEGALRYLRTQWPMAYRIVVVCGAGNNGGAAVYPFATARLAAGEVIVDALLGTGLTGSVRPALVPIIRAINAAGRPVFALDVPSGLDADAGTVAGDAIRAEATVTFVGLKTGLFVGDGPEFAGTVFFDDLELADSVPRDLAPRLTRIVETEIAQVLPRRPRVSNKGDFGRVLIVGSGSGMPGAARLAGEACLRG